MTQTQGREAAPAAERIEKLVSRAGEKLGRLAGRATLRLQQAAQAVRKEADQMDIPESVAAHQGVGPVAARDARATQPATDRAEMLIDQFGQRVGHWAMVSNLQAKRAIARLREDAEDVWVEAQEMRNGWKGGRQEA